jgi:orotidine-5'-phosphate decarboxylase
MKLLAEDRVIVALDVATAQEAIAWCDRLPEVKFWKVGLELFISAGSTIISELKQRHKKVFLDLKLHDIPNTVASACRVAAKYEVDFLTVHAVGGRTMLKAAQTEVEGSSTKLLAVTLLTSISAQELVFDLKIPIELPEYALHLALMAQDCGISGSVCSPHEVESLRSHLGDDFCLVTPGIRLVDGLSHDQQRVMTPQRAIALGADYLVIGRPITTVTDPEQVWKQICREINNFGI